MDILIQVLIIGLPNGLTFALVALGYTTAYGKNEIIKTQHRQKQTKAFLIYLIFQVE